MASRKQERQLQQAREAGQIEPEMDTETGKMINPHNPEFITKRPWYLGESGPSLVHHSKQKSDAVLSMKQADAIVQQRWTSTKKVASGFRKVILLRHVLMVRGNVASSGRGTPLQTVLRIVLRSLYCLLLAEFIEDVCLKNWIWDTKSFERRVMSPHLRRCQRFSHTSNMKRG